MYVGAYAPSARDANLRPVDRRRLEIKLAGPTDVRSYARFGRGARLAAAMGRRKDTRNAIRYNWADFF